MSTLGTTTAPWSPAQVAPVTPARVVRSEWTKLRSLPSTAWSLAATVASIVGLGAGYATIRVTRPPRDAAALTAFDPVAVSLTGAQLAAVATGILGVLLMSSEHVTGAARTTFTAVPQRGMVLAGKAVSVLLAVLVVATPSTVIAFVVGQRVLAAEGLQSSWGDPGVARAVLGTAVYLAVVGVLGVAIGAILRSTVGAVTALFALLFGPQIVVGLLPAVSDAVYAYLPVPAGTAVSAVRPDAAALAPWLGLAVLCGYVLVLLVVGAWLLRRRDVG